MLALHVRPDARGDHDLDLRRGLELAYGAAVLFGGRIALRLPAAGLDLPLLEEEYGRLVAVTEHTDLRRAALWFDSGDTINVMWVRIPRYLNRPALPGKLHPQMLTIPRQ